MHYRILLLAFLYAASAAAGDMRGALEQAWMRNPQARALEAKRAEATALIDAASSLAPAAPSLLLAHRTDRLNRNGGQRETDAGISVPLWLPGQQDAQLRQAQAAAAGLEAEIAARRLKLAGELRDIVHDLREAESGAALERQRAATAKALSEDVARKVKAGELARTDLNLARNEWLNAQDALLQANSRLLAKQQALAALTGSAQLPEGEESTGPARALADDHPLLAADRAKAETARADIGLALRSRRDNPDLELTARRDRASFTDAYATSLNLALKFPLGVESRNRARAAAAQSALAQAEAELDQTRRMLELQLHQARQQLDTAEAQFQLAEQRRGNARENLALLQKAFDLGEKDLFTLLRARETAFAAEADYGKQRIALSRARARLNQTLGVLP